MANSPRILTSSVIYVAGGFFSKAVDFSFVPSGEDDLLSPPQDTSTGLEEVMEQLNNSFPSTRGKIQGSEARTGS